MHLGGVMRAALSAVFVASCLTCSFSAAAESFENEIGFDYSRTHYDKYDYIVQDYGLFGTRFLSPVDTDSGPMGEAVFLARVSSVGMNLMYQSSDSDNYSGTQWQYGFNAKFASKQTPVTASIGIRRINDKSPNPFASGVGHGGNADYEGASGPIAPYWQKTN